MLVTITGYFQEIEKGCNKGEPIRYFNCTYIIVPVGSGYCIQNQQLHISHPSDTELQQLKQLNCEKTEEFETSSASLMSNMPTETTKLTTPSTHNSQLSEDIKHQMTLTLSQQTNMNIEWSLKCLQETQWNYDNAILAFQEFFKRGQIPPEAFIK